MKRHIAKIESGPLGQHYRVKRAFKRSGFIVKTIQRMDYHPVWELSLRPGTATAGRKPQAIRREVSEILRGLGRKCPPKDVGVLVTGEVLKVSFIWEKGQPGIATFWSREPTLNLELALAGQAPIGAMQ
jgi:hypothetical protein